MLGGNNWKAYCQWGWVLKIDMKGLLLGCFFFLNKIKEKKASPSCAKSSRGLEVEPGCEESTEHPPSFRAVRMALDRGWMGNYPEGGDGAADAVPAMALGWGQGDSMCLHLPCLPGCAGLQPGPCKPRGDSHPGPSVTSPRTGPAGKILNRVPWRGQKENYMGKVAGEWPDLAG